MNYKTLTNKDANFPKRLNYIHKPLNQLYVVGELPAGPTVGVVGSRRPSSYGVWATQSIVSTLAANGVTIVSGLAIGIDSIAHKSALDAGGKTIAVLPSGIDYIYPARHSHLARQIVDCGALVSEYASSTKPRKEFFIARNRIVAGLCDLLLVVEATHKSGTMHTVRFANELGIDIGALPGSINSSMSEGTNQLIRDGAYCITSVEDIFCILGLQPAQQSDARLKPLEQTIYNFLQKQPHSVDQLCGALGVSGSELLIQLTHLEINNIVAKTTDGMYALR